MKLLIPKNIFSTLFVLSLDKQLCPEISVNEASLITKELYNDEDSIGLIPSYDLISNRELFVSSKLGIGFTESLSNSYMYFSSSKDLTEVLLRGDISTNEVILSKLVFQERFNILPEFSLDSSANLQDNNYIISGSDNWDENLLSKGISFSEQIFELIEYPYINFVLASNNKSLLTEFQTNVGIMNKEIRSKLDENLNKINLHSDISSYIKREINSVQFDFSNVENQALIELLQLAYYHKISEDLFDIKFVA